jgi:hypothetical protein
MAILCVQIDITHAFISYGPIGCLLYGQSRWPCGLRRRTVAAFFTEIVGSNTAESRAVRLLCLLGVLSVVSSATG